MSKQNMITVSYNCITIFNLFTLIRIRIPTKECISG